MAEGLDACPNCHNLPMCTNYTPTARDRFRAAQWGVAHLPETDWPPEIFPGYTAPILRRSGGSEVANGDLTLELARFGLVPRWSRDAAHAAGIARGTYNARSETAAKKPSFAGPWRDLQWAMVPMENYFEYCWESGRAVRWRIQQASGEPFFCAALWERWRDSGPAANDATSFTLLTVNADQHPLGQRMHRPGDEKRMPMIFDATGLDPWLHATPDKALAMTRLPPPLNLVGEPAPKTSAKVATATTGNLF